MPWSYCILLSFNMQGKAERRDDFIFKQEQTPLEGTYEVHQSPWKSGLKKWFGKTRRLLYRVMVKTGPKTPKGNKGAWAFTHCGKRPSCRSTAAGTKSNECRLRGWEPDSWKGKWKAWKWRKDRDIQRVEASLLTEEPIAGEDGEMLFQLGAACWPTLQGRKWHKTAFCGSDFILFYPPLVVYVAKQSPCTITQNSENSIIQAHLKQFGGSRGRQNAQTESGGATEL